MTRPLVIALALLLAVAAAVGPYVVAVLGAARCVEGAL